MNLSIIIVNYNQKDLLKLCWQNIINAQVKLSYEVILVDNNSFDQSQKVIEGIVNQASSMAVKIVLNNRNLGFAKAVNQGIAASQGEYVLILNPDIIVMPGAIEKLYQFMQEHPRCAVSGPQLLNPSKNIQNSAFRFPKWYTPILRRTFLGRLSKKYLNSYLMKDWDHQSTREVDWLLGAALMVRGSTIKQVGPMDERFFLYFEDVEWCRRFKRAGWQIYYVAPAQMYHFYQRSSADQGWQALFKKITWIHLSSAIKYFLK
jgi:GT2 family glycosyltransferase